MKSKTEEKPKKTNNKSIEPSINIDNEIFSLLDGHINYCDIVAKTNKVVKKIKNIRQPNFPEIISEYIAKICYENKTKKCVLFGKSGDLVCETNKIEVKAFTSSGPSSFGPEESWKELIFVDATNFRDSQFKVYLINLSNDSEKWKKLKINKMDTYADQCEKKRRPRIQFQQICDQLEENVKLIFDGKICIKDNKIKLVINK